MRGNKSIRFQVLASFFCLFALVLSACGTQQTTTTNKLEAASADKQVFRYPMSGKTDFGTLDPALVQDASDSYAIQAVFTGLVQFDDSGKVQDQLASSHTVSTDGMTYTFKLKPNLKFSDGTSLTTKDVAYSINRALDPITKSEVTSYLALLKDSDKIADKKSGVTTLIGDSIKIVDDTTIQLILSAPAAYFLQTLTYPTAYVVEKKLIDQYADKWTDHLTEGGGDGPFKVSSYSHTTGLILVPNDNYYGAKPQLKRLEMPFSGDAETTYKSYLSGQYDYAGVPAADLEVAKKRKDFISYPILVIRYVTMNYMAKPFDNIKVRQAFALALKKKLITETVLKGAVQPTNHLVPEGMFGTSKTLTGPAGVSSPDGDQEKAKTLLKEGLAEEKLAAFPDVTFTYYTKSATIKKVVDALVNQWNAILGVTLKTNAVDFDELVKQEGQTIGNTGPLQMWILGWQADYPDPQDWLSIFFDKGASYNNNNYGQNSSTAAADQVTVQKQLETADKETDPAKRLSLYNAAEQKLVNDVAWIPLYQSQGLILQNSKLQGYVNDSLGITAPDDWGKIYMAK